jgi:hypothetical protein
MSLRLLPATVPCLALMAGFALVVTPQAKADEVETTLEAALEAWRAGDVAGAKMEIDYAAQLVAQAKAATLAAFLPEAMEGWTREENDDQSGAAAMAMFGGGLTASATYVGPNRATVEIQMVADNQMVAGMGAMLSNPAMMGQMGKVKRIGRQMVLVNQQDEIQAMVANRVLVTVGGSAPLEQKEAYFAAIDAEALGRF